MIVWCSQECSTEAAEEPNDQDVVLIKEETAKEEVNGKEAAEELLLNEDGKRGNTLCHHAADSGTDSEFTLIFRVKSHDRR